VLAQARAAGARMVTGVTVERIAMDGAGCAGRAAQARGVVVRAGGRRTLLPANVYVADASLLPHSLGKPPMLTIIALARRVAAASRARIG